MKANNKLLKEAERLQDQLIQNLQLLIQVFGYQDYDASIVQDIFTNLVSFIPRIDTIHVQVIQKNDKSKESQELLALLQDSISIIETLKKHKNQFQNLKVRKSLINAMKHFCDPQQIQLTPQQNFKQLKKIQNTINSSKKEQKLNKPIQKNQEKEKFQPKVQNQKAMVANFSQFGVFDNFQSGRQIKAQPAFESWGNTWGQPAKNEMSWNNFNQNKTNQQQQQKEIVEWRWSGQEEKKPQAINNEIKWNWEEHAQQQKKNNQNTNKFSSISISQDVPQVEAVNLTTKSMTMMINNQSQLANKTMPPFRNSQPQLQQESRQLQPVYQSTNPQIAKQLSKNFGFQFQFGSVQNKQQPKDSRIVQPAAEQNIEAVQPSSKQYNWFEMDNKQFQNHWTNNVPSLQAQQHKFQLPMQYMPKNDFDWFGQSNLQKGQAQKQETDLQKQSQKPNFRGRLETFNSLPLKNMQQKQPQLISTSRYQDEYIERQNSGLQQKQQISEKNSQLNKVMGINFTQRNSHPKFQQPQRQESRRQDQKQDPFTKEMSKQLSQQPNKTIMNQYLKEQYKEIPIKEDLKPSTYDFFNFFEDVPNLINPQTNKLNQLDFSKINQSQKPKQQSINWSEIYNTPFQPNNQFKQQRQSSWFVDYPSNFDQKQAAPDRLKQSTTVHQPKGQILQNSLKYPQNPFQSLKSNSIQYPSQIIELKQEKPQQFSLRKPLHQQVIQQIFKTPVSNDLPTFQIPPNLISKNQIKGNQVTRKSQPDFYNKVFQQNFLPTPIFNMNLAESKFTNQYNSAFNGNMRMDLGIGQSFSPPKKRQFSSCHLLDIQIAPTLIKPTKKEQPLAKSQIHQKNKQNQIFHLNMPNTLNNFQIFQPVSQRKKQFEVSDLQQLGQGRTPGKVQLGKKVAQLAGSRMGVFLYSIQQQIQNNKEKQKHDNQRRKQKQKQIQIKTERYMKLLSQFESLANQRLEIQYRRQRQGLKKRQYIRLIELKTQWKRFNKLHNLLKLTLTSLKNKKKGAAPS